MQSSCMQNPMFKTSYYCILSQRKHLLMLYHVRLICSYCFRRKNGVTREFVEHFEWINIVCLVCVLSQQRCHGRWWTRIPIMRNKSETETQERLLQYFFPNMQNWSIWASVNTFVFALALICFLNPTVCSALFVSVFMHDVCMDPVSLIIVLMWAPERVVATVV